MELAYFDLLPSKYAGPRFTSHPVRLGSAQERWPEVSLMILAHRLAYGPEPFGPNLTQSARTKSDLGQFFAQYDQQKNANESESGKLVAGRLRSARNLAQ